MTSPVTTFSTTQTTTNSAVVVVNANNASALVLGVTVAIVVVLLILGLAAVGYCFYHRQRRKVQPDSEETLSTTVSCESESDSQSVSDSHPTNTSHVTIMEEDLAKPEMLTPYQLRKQFVESFPYQKWRRAYDGSLRPRISLHYVHPSQYSRGLSRPATLQDNMADLQYMEGNSVAKVSSIRSSRHSRRRRGAHKASPRKHSVSEVSDGPGISAYSEDLQQSISFYRESERGVTPTEQDEGEGQGTS